MHRPASTRFGAQYQINKQRVEFSYFPVSDADKVLPVIYAASPWALMRIAVAQGPGSDEQKRMAISCLRQAEDLFSAAETAQIDGAKPMLLYYSIFNIVKTVAFGFGGMPITERMNHGMSMAEGYTDRLNASCAMTIYPTSSNSLYELAKYLRLESYVPSTVSVRDLSMQSVVGHRILCKATGASERFIPIRFGQVEVGPVRENDERMYAAVTVREEDVLAAGLERTSLAYACGFDAGWEVRHDNLDGRFHLMLWKELGRLEDNGLEYLKEYVAMLRPVLHRVATNQSPAYRRYYLYAGDPKTKTLPQLLAVYALLFYFGSLNRYQPVKFQELLSSSDGPFVQEFVQLQPTQLLYLLASEICKQEIAKPAVV